MKKLMIVPVVALGLLFSTNVTAQDAKVAENEKETAMLTVENESQQLEEAQKEFTQIEANQVPEAVQAALAKDFEGATIVEAHVAKDETYKLVVDLNGEKSTLYADASGNWIKK